MMLTGRWFPQIVDYKGQWESISNIYITKIVVLVSEPVRGRSRVTGGGLGSGLVKREGLRN